MSTSPFVTEVGDTLVIRYNNTSVIVNTIDPVALCRSRGGSMLVTEFGGNEVKLSPRI